MSSILVRRVSSSISAGIHLAAFMFLFCMPKNNWAILITVFTAAVFTTVGDVSSWISHLITAIPCGEESVGIVLFNKTRDAGPSWTLVRLEPLDYKTQFFVV